MMAYPAVIPASSATANFNLCLFLFEFTFNVEYF